MIDFSDKTFIVTGGAQGIGRGIVTYLLAAGACVVVADRDEEAGNELVNEMNEPDRLLVHPTDVGSERQVRQCVSTAVARFAAIDGLVNNAGIANPRRIPVAELELADWETVIRTNLTGTFLTVKHCAPYLQKRHGAVVNICSTRAVQSEPNTEAYAATKGGLLSLTHALAISLGSAVRVNAILPGWIDVGPYRKKSARQEPVTDPKEHAQHPVGRIGRPEDIAALTAFLLSEAAGFITGQGFIVDGGMTRKMIYLE